MRTSWTDPVRPQGGNVYWKNMLKGGLRVTLVIAYS